jgi:hypothetical protein
MGDTIRKRLMRRFYENYDSAEAQRINQAIYEAKLRAAGLPIPKRPRKKRAHQLRAPP